jgi:hypothetical protein
LICLGISIDFVICEVHMENLSISPSMAFNITPKQVENFGVPASLSNMPQKGDIAAKSPNIDQSRSKNINAPELRLAQVTFAGRKYDNVYVTSSELLVPVSQPEGVVIPADKVEVVIVKIPKGYSVVAIVDGNREATGGAVLVPDVKGPGSKPISIAAYWQKQVDKGNFSNEFVDKRQFEDVGFQGPKI